MKFIVVLTFLVLVPSVALADPAEKLFSESLMELKAGAIDPKRYEAAAQGFLRAYELSPNWEILEAAVRARLKQNRFDEAEKLAARIVVDHPDAADQGRALVEKARRKRDTFEATVRTGISELKTKVFDANAGARLASDALVLKREETKEVGRWSWMATTGTVIAGIGVAALVHSLIIDGDVRDLNQQLADRPTAEEYDVIFPKWRSKAIQQGVSTIGGATLLIGGAGLILWDLTTEETTYQFELGSDGTGVAGSATWTF